MNVDETIQTPNENLNSENKIIKQEEQNITETENITPVELKEDSSEVQSETVPIDSSAEIISETENVSSVNTETNTANINSDTISSEVESVEITTENRNEESTENRVLTNEETPKQSKAPLSEQFDEVFKELKSKLESDEAIQVSIESKIKGGYKAFYKQMPVFLPFPYAIMKKNPNEKEINTLLGENLTVKVSELHTDETNRKIVIVSRKALVEKEFWTKLKVGEEISGPVTSIAKFGVFIDLGGFEGLLHHTKIPHSENANLSSFYKKGMVVNAFVASVNKEKQRISLSRLEYEKEKKLQDLENEFPIGSTHNGRVCRIIETGAFVELKPGIDGFLHKSELSWLKRLKHPSEILSLNQNVDVLILNIDKEKRYVSLGYRSLTENPWKEIIEKYPVNTEYKGKVIKKVEQGVLVRINDEIDGFLPRSKMPNLTREDSIPYKVSEMLDIVISEISPDDESLIVSVKESEESKKQALAKKNRKNNVEKKSKPVAETSTDNNNSFSFADLLSDEIKDKLFGDL